MKYVAELDKDRRYQQMEMTALSAAFGAKINVSYPSPGYKIQISDAELTQFGQELYLEWQSIFNKKVKAFLNGFDKSNILESPKDG